MIAAIAAAVSATSSFCFTSDVGGASFDGLGFAAVCVDVLGEG
ncbi:hypothetical protein ABIC09_000017 [Bradyrhizobium sp. S3.12.5]